MNQHDIDAACALHIVVPRPLDWQDRLVLSASLVTAIAVVALLILT